jgi:uncharacterized protein YyaL (SSP411 family)
LVSFRFSPNPNLAHQIDWMPWGEAAFAKAQAENKPVLLSISAVWCYWCHVMDETSYSDPDVARLIDQSFIAVRVDNDHRPDLNSRYNVGGWPTTAFLTGHGGLIGGATYLPPDQFLSMLSELSRAYEEDRADLYDQARGLLRQRQERVGKITAGPELEDSLPDQVARSLAGAYDAINGGFGQEPKFPNGPILHYLVHLTRTTGEDFYRSMLVKSLDRMSGGPLYDSEEGGFFRNAGNADWTDPQREKMLEDNVILAQVYLDAYSLLGTEDYLRVASQTVDYIVTSLFDQEIPGFRGSQGAHSDYFNLPAAVRMEQDRPAADPFCYTSGNAQAVSLLLDAAWRLGRPELTEIAAAVLDHLESKAQAGQLSHVYDGSGSGEGLSFLMDWAELLIALTDAHGYTGREHYLERAKSVVTEILDRFYDETGGGFFDIESKPQPIGYLRVREKPLAENVSVAIGMLKLWQATRDDDYRQIAETTLSACASTFHEYGAQSAGYGLAVSMLKNSPVEVTVEGRPEDSGTSQMIQAAAQLSCANLVIKPVLVDESELPAQAHVCLDTLCLPPVTDPDLLEGLVKEMMSPVASPFENVFDRLAGI